MSARVARCLLFRAVMSNATKGAIADLLRSDSYLRLRHAKRMALSMRSLLEEPGFLAGNLRTRAAWIYLFGEEVLEEDATEVE